MIENTVERLHRIRQNEAEKALEPNYEVNLKSEQILKYLDEFFGGWTIIKKNTTDQKYNIPRDGITSRLTTKVISFVARK